MDVQTKTTIEALQADYADIHRQRGWFLALGLFLMAMGIVAAVFPFIATLAITVSTGAVLVVPGIAQLVHAFGVQRWGGTAVTVIGALLSLAVGTLLLFEPVPGMLALTLVVSGFLLVGGAFKIMLAFRLRPLPGWPWLLLAGSLAVLLGALILAYLPPAAGWVPGLLVGVDLLFSGWWLVMLTAALRRMDTGVQPLPAPAAHDAQGAGSR
jgi:uncharacterized membrane protein HdeD (DUF308 family)